MVRFCDGIPRAPTPDGSPNLGPGYRFHYLPHRPPTHPFNLDSAEYASETCHFVLFHEQAVRAGMPLLAPEHYRLMRAWVEHIVCAYWTHGGYLNWDTGYGFKRWHAGRTWALAQQGLLAIAVSPRFHNRPEIGSWSKYMFDRGLRFTSGSRARRSTPRASRRRTFTTSTSRRSARASARCSPPACRRMPPAPWRSGSVRWAPASRPRSIRSTPTSAG